MKDINKVENIVLVSLADKFCKGVAVSLAKKLDMFNTDVKEMIVYDLINPKEVLEKCGIEYLKKRQRGVISSIKDYQSTVISIDFNMFKDNYDLFEKSLIIYLDLPIDLAEGTINSLDYNFRTQFLKKTADKVIALDNRLRRNAVINIISYLGGI